MTQAILPAGRPVRLSALGALHILLVLVVLLDVHFKIP